MPATWLSENTGPQRRQLSKGFRSDELPHAGPKALEYGLIGSI